MTHDSKGRIIQAKDIPTIANDGVNIFHVNLLEAPNTIFVPNTEDGSITNEGAETMARAILNGVYPEEENEINIVYPDFSHLGGLPDSSQIEKTTKQLADLYLADLQPDKGQEYIQAIIHEKKHIDDLGGMVEEINGYADFAEKIRMFTSHHYREIDDSTKPKIVSIYDGLQNNLYGLLSLKEPRAILEEVVCLRSVGLSEKTASHRHMMELMSSLILTDGKETSHIKICLEDFSQLDDHVTADILLFWGPEVFDPDSNSHTNWERMVQTTNIPQEYKNVEMTALQAVSLAIYTKAQELLSGKDILPSTEEMRLLEEKYEKCWNSKIESLKSGIRTAKELLPDINYGSE